MTNKKDPNDFEIEEGVFVADTSGPTPNGDALKAQVDAIFVMLMSALTRVKSAVLTRYKINPNLHLNRRMKIKTIQSPQYGEYYCREVGRIDYARLPDGWESWINKFSPVKYFGSIMAYATPLTEERIQKGMTQPTVITYNVPLRRDNLEWPKNNPECKYMQWAKERKVRVKYLPIGETDHSLKKWLIETLPYMDEGWVEDNDWVLSFP